MEKVTLSEGNPSRQPRPYQRLDCWQANRRDKKRSHWVTDDVSKAETCPKHGAHPRASGGCC